MSTTIQQVPTDTYGLDPVHSSFGFGVRYNGLATFRSSFDKVDAQLADGVLTGSADVSSIVIDEPRFKGHVLRRTSSTWRTRRPSPSARPTSGPPRTAASRSTAS